MDGLEDIFKDGFKADPSKLLNRILELLAENKQFNFAILLKQVELEAQLKQLREKVLDEEEISVNALEVSETTKLLTDLIHKKAEADVYNLLSQILKDD